ncbi:hypothetical protein [Sphingomonas sp. PvP056]|uniref:hypothetical protein n=1 Tax=Sphingomonas sp. PvP056 TaxID=3156392 RepID=UPI00339AB83B
MSGNIALEAVGLAFLNAKYGYQFRGCRANPQREIVEIRTFGAVGWDLIVRLASRSEIPD